MESQGPFLYRIFGLLIQANHALPGLYDAESKGENEVDLHIMLGPFPGFVEKMIATPEGQYYFEPGLNPDDPPQLVVNTLHRNSYFHFQYDTGVEFVIAGDATHVWGCWVDQLFLEDAVLYLQGPILSFVLRLRGVVCLHASSVVIEGQAVAFGGYSGAGKSTLAAAYCASGFSLLTDDVLPLVKKKGTIFAVSGYPRLRLYENSSPGFGVSGADLPHLSSNWEKRYLDLGDKNLPFLAGAIPIRCIYIFDWSKAGIEIPEILPVRPAEAIPLLAALSYGNKLLDDEMKRIEFHFLADVAENVAVKTISPVDEQERISELLKIIEDDQYEE